MKKTLYTLLVLISVVPLVSHALPSTRSEQNINPFVTSRYELGTSTKSWVKVTTDELCLTADSCQTAWPSGASLTGGSAFTLAAWSSPTTLTSTSSINVGSINATTTLATSTFSGAVTGLVETFCFALSDETTDLVTSSSTVTWRSPFAGTLTNIRSSVASSSLGANVVVNLKESGTTVLSTRLSIDATEETSVTATTPVVISDTSIADDAEMTWEIDTVGSTGPGKGLKACVYMKR